MLKESMGIKVESPAGRDAVALIDALDAYLLDLYPPEHNHLLSVDALPAPAVTSLTARPQARRIEVTSQLTDADSHLGRDS